MKYLVIILAIIATAHALGAWKGGLSVRYDSSILGIGRSHFVNVPRTIAEAKTARWVQTPRPEGPMPELVMYCPTQNVRNVCAFFDDTGYMAGIQIAIPEDKFQGAIFDWEVQGFTKWTPPATTLGVQTIYWTTQQYFINEDYLAVPAANRIAERDPDRTIQFENVWVTGFNKELMAISVDGDKIANTAQSNFTKQACQARKGRHYYYRMTALTACTADSLLPWFPLVHSGELIGMGAVMFGKLNEKDLITDFFERPSASDIKRIVPDGPQCLYDLAVNPAIVTMHTYYINTPWLVNCIGQ